MTTTILGNATAAPQERTHGDGAITATVRVAVNGRYFDVAKQEWVDRKPEFVTVYARRALARHLLESVRKGDPLIASGRLGSNEWVHEGKTEHTLTLQAESIGHDLTYGTSRYERSRRRVEPDVDEQSGETVPEATDTDATDAETSSSAGAPADGSYPEPRRLASVGAGVSGEESQDPPF